MRKTKTKSKKLNHFKTAMLIIALTFAGNMCVLNAQVTIGSGERPNKGALLDLKQQDDFVTSTKGFLLPRVELTSISNLFPMFTSDGSGGYIDANKAVEDEAHIGLLVFNIGGYDKVENIDMESGIYVWTGTQWNNSLLMELTTAGDVRRVTDNGVDEITLSYKDETTTYHYADFGDAGTWMTENLATRYLPDGSLLTLHTANSDTDPQYIGPNRIAHNDPLVNTTANYGLFYNWPAATYKENKSTADQGQVGYLSANPATPGTNEVETVESKGWIKGICPKGWHLPSDREWNKLEKELTMHASRYTLGTADATWTNSWETTTGWRGGIQGKVTKSTTKVNNQATSGDSKTSVNGGFDVLSLGYHYSATTASGYGTSFFLWSASSNGSSNAYYRVGYNTDSNINRSSSSRYYLMSVRCKKDE
ncbi:FISUMP domain-containing protein [Dysgonomonas sp. 25]|uniref:FISUMP domain-containing protein n=1 Tax=Dysgonomonas sp. 25 TaxID=2302933 RepID=UPI0013D86BC2|nr:FISUMP domain-containing protein [Dysgonomonas sp. 25]NDV69373.1 hypothetical protein [Dysgonomonas sp. 25]